MTSKELITHLYIGYFDRAPDPAGLAFWIAVLESGFPLEDIANAFSTQAESAETYDFLDPDAPQDAVTVEANVETFITEVYDNLFNRLPDAAGLEFWTMVLADGFPVGTFVLAVIQGASAADEALLASKVEVACAWSDAAAADDGFVLDDAYIEGSGAALDGVTDDPATVDAGKDAAALFFQEAPTISLDNVTFALDEDFDTSVGQKIADIVVSDDGLGTNDLALTGADADLFEIVGAELFLKAGVALDFETNPTLDVTVTVDDASVGESPDDSVDLSVQINDVDEAPSVTLENAITTLSELADTSAAVKLADIVVSDDALGTATLALEGEDAALFEIVGTELFLKAGTVLDFESVSALAVSVTVDDPALGATPDDSALLAVAITDENEPPSLSLTQTLAGLSEDADTSAALKVADIVVTDDALGSNELALDGADAGLFEIVGTELFLAAGTTLDFETNPSLDVTVTVDDAGVGGSPDDSAALSLPITDVNEVPGVTLTPVVTELAENTDITADLKVADVTVDDDALGTNTVLLTGADAGLFELLGMELFLKAGTPLNFESNPALNVAVTIDDPALGGDPDDTAPLTISVTDLNEAPSVALGNATTFLLESTDTSTRIKVADILLSDDALGTNVLDLTGDDAALFEIDGMELFLKAGTVLNFEANSSLDVSVTVDDASLGVSPDSVAPLSIAVTDVNDPPTVALSGLSAGLPEDLDTTFRVKVADIVITDDVAGSNTLGLTGADAGLFEIDGTVLFLKAGTALDFETGPSLVVNVTIDDPTLGTGVDDSAAAAIPVTDVNEAPAVSLNATLTTLPEDTNTLPRIKVADIVVSDDGLGTNALGLTGVDANGFEIDGTELFLKAGVVLDFETNPLLDVSVTVDDATVGGSPDSTALFTLNVTNVNEEPVLTLLNAETELFEGTNTSSRVLVATISLSDDGTGTNTLGLVGSDAALFEIDGTGLFLKAGTVLDADANPALDVAVTVDDPALPGSPDDTAALSIEVEPGAPGAVADNTESLTLTGNSSSVVRFGQINVPDADPDTPGNQPGFVINENPDGVPYAGVAGNALSLIDTTGHDGLVSLGVISRVDSDGLVAGGEGFLLDNSGSSGDVDACLGTGDVFGVLVTPELDADGEWTFDNSGATGSMEITIKQVIVSAGGLLNFLNADIVIGGDVDLTALGDGLSIDAASTIEVIEGGKLTLTVAQVDALETAGLVLFGEGTVCVIGESGEDGTAATDGIDTDFANLQTATVDLSAVTLLAADLDDTIDIVVSGAASDDSGTDLVVDGTRVAQTIIGTAENDAVMVAASAADVDTSTLDVILRLGADSGDIGDPADTPVGTADPAEVVGDTIDLDATLANVRINADAGFDSVVGAFGISNRIIIDVDAGAEFYAPIVTVDYSADSMSANDGTAVLEAVGLLDRDIDISAAGGTSGWTLIGAAGSTETILISGDQNDTLIDGVPDDDNNNNEEDEFTGGAGNNAFVFNVSSSTPATFADTEIQAAADLEFITVTATPIASDSSAALMTVEYQLNNVTTVAVVNDTNAGFDIDFSDDASVASGIATVMNSISGITAVVDGGMPTQVNLEGDDGNLLNINMITPNGAAGGAGLTTVLDTADDGDGNANDATDTGDDDAQITDVTLTGSVTAGEIYFLTVTLRGGSEIEAQYEAMPGDDLEDVRDGLLSNTSTTGINDIAAGAVVGSAGGGTNILRITDGDDDNGGFTVTVSAGQAVLNAASSSSILTGAEVSLAVADVDEITDFIDDDDTLSFGLAAGSSDNYDEDAREANYVDAATAANAAFTGDLDLIYFLTGSDADDTGLLFVNANGDGAADFLVSLTGVTEANFDDSNIV